MKKMFVFMALLGTFCCITAQHPKTDDLFLVVGTYTTGKKSEGIYIYRFNTATGAVEKVGNVTKLNDPSFLAFSPDQRFLYAVNERGANNDNGGKVSSFAFNSKTGALTPLNSEPSGGDNPCYISTDRTGKWVAVSNYSSGTLSILPVNGDGTLGSPTTVKHEGKGPNEQRQEKAHVHSAVFSTDGKYLFVPDLGIDKIMIYNFDASTGKLTAAKKPFATLPAGSGPRHFVFSKDNRYAYLMKEMSGSVTAFKYDGHGALTAIQEISSHPDTYKDVKGSADIHLSPDGKFLYASNRGSANSLGIFSVDQQTGKLQNIGFQSTLGETPRNFSIDPTGNWLLVGHQGSDDIVIFKRNKTTGLLTDTGKRISVGAAVCLKWATPK